MRRYPYSLLNMIGVLLVSMITGCASVNSGLQAGDVPPSGAFVADNGITFNVQQLSMQTLPVEKATVVDSNVYDLVKTSGRVDYRISEGDILSIVLTGYPDITPTTDSSNNPFISGFPVDQQGFVQFPLIGRIKASGMSVPQFTATLQRQLQRYLKYPDPQVKIVNYRGSNFFVDGEVRQSGEFTIADVPVSLYSAISMAGGTTEEGDSNNIVLNRKGNSYHLGLETLQKVGLSANNIYLQDGDAIHVNSQTRNKVYMLGEFGRLAPVVIPDYGLSLAHVLGESSGLNANTANAAKVYIVRDNPKYQYTDIYYVDMQTITSLALANRFEMRANDILYVDPTGLTRWNRVVSALLPSTSAISTISGL